MRTLVKMPSPTPRSANMDFFKVWASDEASGDLDEIIRHWRRQDRRLLDGLPVEEPVAEAVVAPAAPEPEPMPRQPGRPVPPRGPVPRALRPRPHSPAAPAGAGPTKWPPSQGGR
jgi:hypothetical protein